MMGRYRWRGGFCAAWVLMLAALLAGVPALAQESALPLDERARADNSASAQQLEADLRELSKKLRCLVCQNQSIADSNAPLAVDLRNQVREQLSAGRSKDDVIDYLVSRYGDFVLYEPPVRAATLLLWTGPPMLALAGLGWLGWRLRQRVREQAAERALSGDEAREARALLGIGKDDGESRA